MSGIDTLAKLSPIAIEGVLLQKPEGFGKRGGGDKGYSAKVRVFLGQLLVIICL